MRTVPEWISSASIYPRPAGGNGPVAGGSFVVADAVAINFAIFKGKEGYRISLPSTPNPRFNKDLPLSKENRKFYDEVRPMSSERRQELETYLVSLLDEKTGPAQDVAEADFPF